MGGRSTLGTRSAIRVRVSAGHERRDPFSAEYGRVTEGRAWSMRPVTAVASWRSAIECFRICSRGCSSWRRRWLLISRSPRKRRRFGSSRPKCTSRGRFEQQASSRLRPSDCWRICDPTCTSSRSATVLSRIRATRPDRCASRTTSAVLSRENGRPSVAGSSHASALIWTTSSGGENPGPPRAWTFRKAGQALLEEPLAPQTDDIASDGERRGDLVIGRPRPTGSYVPEPLENMATYTGARDSPRWLARVATGRCGTGCGAALDSSSSGVRINRADQNGQA